MGFVPIMTNDDEILSAILTVSTNCRTCITVDEAIKQGVEYTEDDVNIGTLRGVKYSTLEDNMYYMSSKIEEIQTAWITLGFKDGEFVPERRLNQIYLDYVNKKANEKKRIR